MVVKMNKNGRVKTTLKFKLRDMGAIQRDGKNRWKCMYDNVDNLKTAYQKSKSGAEESLLTHFYSKHRELYKELMYKIEMEAEL